MAVLNNQRVPHLPLLCQVPHFLNTKNNIAKRRSTKWLIAPTTPVSACARLGKFPSRKYVKRELKKSIKNEGKNRVFPAWNLGILWRIAMSFHWMDLVLWRSGRFFGDLIFRRNHFQNSWCRSSRSPARTRLGWDDGPIQLDSSWSCF